MKRRPVIKIWQLPEMTQDDLKTLYEKIVASVVSVREIPAADKKDMIILFPADQMKHDLGRDIVIEVVGGLFSNDNAKNLLGNISAVIEEYFPEACVAGMADALYKHGTPARVYWNSEL